MVIVVFAVVVVVVVDLVVSSCVVAGCVVVGVVGWVVVVDGGLVGVVDSVVGFAVVVVVVLVVEGGGFVGRPSCSVIPHSAVRGFSKVAANT